MLTSTTGIRSALRSIAITSLILFSATLRSAFAQSPPTGEPLDVNSIRQDLYEIQLSAGFGSGIIPGTGVNMEEPLFPKQVPFSPFLEATAPLAKELSAADLESNRLSVSTSFRDNASIDEEAAILAASFKASFGIGNARAALRTAQESRRTGRAVYFFYSLTAETKAIRPASIVWRTDAIKAVESEQDPNLRLKRFISSFGSHYVHSVQYGARLAVRADLKTLDESRQRDLAARVNLALGKFAGGGRLSQQERESLSTTDITITAELTAGGVVPSTQSVVLTSLEQVASFLNDFRSGTIRLVSGPVSARVLSYWNTIDRDAAPKLYADLAPTVRSPATSPFGVPSGTVIAWVPRPGDVVNTSSGSTIVPPAGWVLCDGRGACPDLRDRFVVGTNDAQSVGKQSGQASVRPTGRAVFNNYAPGEINWQRNQGRQDPFSRVYRIEAEPISLIPPATALVYIMKL